MARDSKEIVTRRTVALPPREDLPVGQLERRLKRALPNMARTTTEGWLQAVVDLNEPDIQIHVYKKTKLVAGGLSKVGEWAMPDCDPDTVEEALIRSWGAGQYQLRPVFDRAYFGPSSLMFRVGEEADDILAAKPGGSVEETDAVIATTVKRASQLAVARDLQRIARANDGEEDGDGMKKDELVGLMSMQMAPLTAMLEATNRRAEAAEQRNHDLITKLLESRSTASSGMAPILGDLLKNVKPEVWQILMNGGTPTEETGGWLSVAREVAREFGPAIQQIVMTLVQRGGLGALTTPASPHQALPTPTLGRETPSGTSTPTGEGTMPMQLNEEQTMAKELLLGFVREGDHANAFACLETFPGFVPTGNGGAMLMGEFLISRIDPKVSPKVYLPTFLTIVPETRDMAGAIEGFIRYIQQRLLADDEAMKRQQSQGPQPTDQLA